jgi:hypothetical protein
MKRIRGTLFDGDDPTIYVVDTSAWLDVDLRPDSDKCWQILIGLIKAKRIIGCKRVLKELEPRGLYDRRLAAYAELLTDGCRETGGAFDIEYNKLAGEITRRFPGMGKPRSPKTPADAFVIALAKLDNYTVVVNESPTTRRNRKMPAVCEAVGVPWISLADLIRTEGK